MKEIGELLKQKRMSLNVSLEEVSSVTKINIKSLQAIEDGDLERLPAKTFVRGFVQTYAKYLGLNAQEILEKLQTVLGSTRPKPEASSSDQATTMRKPVNTDFTGGGKNIVTVGAILLTIIAIAIIQRIVSRHEAELKSTDVQAITGNDVPVAIKTPTPAPSASPSASAAAVAVPTPVAQPSVQPKPAEVVKAAPSPTPLPAPKPKVLVKAPSPAPVVVAAVAPKPEASAPPPPQEDVPQEVIVEALDNVMVKVSLDGKPSQDVNLTTDQIQTFKAKGKLRLSTPNGGAINITYNGKEIGVPGNLGQPKTMVFPP